MYKLRKYYLALGDSITAGYGVGKSNFTTMYYSYLQNRGMYVDYKNYGVLGLTSRHMMAMLYSNTVLRGIIANTAVMTMTIGSNDLLDSAGFLPLGKIAQIKYALYNLERNLELIGYQLRSVNPYAHVKIATIYNPLAAGPYSFYTGQAQVIITQANGAIFRLAKRYGFHVAAVDKAFYGIEPFVLGTDRIHPNLLGHQIIARECCRTGF